MAARARVEGTLLQRTPLPTHPGLRFEMWRNGDDYVALLVSDVEESDASDVEAVASTTFRGGPLSPAMIQTLRSKLPAESAAGRLRERLAVWRRERLAGMVHVYVRPEWRGAARGEELSRRALKSIRALGFSHCLTLADDSGSGKLRAWYSAQGFAPMDEFGETAMVARTTNPHPKV